jgi:hypothetical protein
MDRRYSLVENHNKGDGAVLGDKAQNMHMEAGFPKEMKVKIYD